MKKVAFYTLGCKVNQYDTEGIIELFEQKNYEVVDFEKYADVYVINTCTVTNLGDRKSRQFIRKAKKNNPDSIVAVIGCYAQIAPEEVASIEGVNIIIGTKDKDKIVNMVEEVSKGQNQINIVQDISKFRDFEEIPIEKYKGKTRAFLKIQEGCDQFCSYCIIPYARGRVRSRKPEDIIKEVKKLSEQNFKEVVLTGIHIASYGKDLKDVNLLEVIKEINSIDGIERIRLGSVEPRMFTKEFTQELAKLEKVCPHFHLSLQSGCDETLQRMNRKYTTAEYMESVNLIKQYIKDYSLTTDIIVGFPGETDQEFEKTKGFVKEVGFYDVHIFKFSPREGTKAATMKEQVDSLIKEKRSSELQGIVEGLKNQYITQYLKSTMKVLFEQENKKFKGHYEGLTENYISVIVKSEADIKGQILDVELLNQEGEFIKGKI